MYIVESNVYISLIYERLKTHRKIVDNEKEKFVISRQ